MAAAVAPTAAHAFEAAPAVGSPFEWSALWDTRGSAAVQQPKRTGLRTEEVAAILETDLKEGKYILTGALTPEIFADDCRFVDPNNAVNGLAKYRKALSFLFRPEESTLQDVRVSVTSDKSAITAQYTASGVLKLPWRPRIQPWAGYVTYSLNGDGLISSQVDVWNITRLDAIRQTFTPSSS